MIVSGGVAYFPMPYTTDQGEIDRGRWRALAQYQAASTDEERRMATVWWQHWDHVAQMNAILQAINEAVG